MEIVVARYKENIAWTKQLENVIIYNKGEPLNDNYNEHFLQNVGREGHTYYTHIYEHYDELSDYTVFLQGGPFPHAPNIINDLKKLQKEYDTNKDLHFDFKFITHFLAQCNIKGCPLGKNIPIASIYEKIFGKRLEEMPFFFGTGAHFIVSRKQIHKHPKEFYLNIIKILEYHINPIEGHSIERLHPFIFEANQYLNTFLIEGDGKYFVVSDEFHKKLESTS
jgi:hypothetical protein